MLYDVLKETIKSAWSTPQYRLLSTIALAILGLLLWRLWAFTIHPLYHPDEPKELPHWIPYFGHGGSFFKDSHRLIAYGVKKFGGQREPFAMTIAGAKYYVISSPNDSTAYYDSLITFSWDGFLNDILIGFGFQSKRLDMMWKEPRPKTAFNPSGKCVIHLTQDLYKKHLLPGPTFETLMNDYKTALNQLMDWRRMTSIYSTAKSSQTGPVSLYDFCSNVLIDALQMTLFDPILFSINPNMTANLRKFSDELWKLRGKPSPFLDSKEVRSIRDEYTRAFLIYQRLPKEMRKGESWFVTALIDQYKEMGCEENEVAALLVLVYWAGDANAYKLAFWLMSYILFDPELHKAIRQETSPGISGSDFDMQYLAENCPLLRSVYHETLRLTKRDLAFRRVGHDTILGGKLLRKGNIALSPGCQLHTNEDVFGADSARFVPDRFLKQPKLTSDNSYRVYGGGKTYCPGRFFALQEICGFVALLIHRLDVQLVVPQAQKFPVPDESLLTLGVSRPLPGSDVLVTLSQNVRPNAE